MTTQLQGNKRLNNAYGKRTGSIAIRTLLGCRNILWASLGDTPGQVYKLSRGPSAFSHVSHLTSVAEKAPEKNDSEMGTVQPCCLSTLVILFLNSQKMTLMPWPLASSSSLRVSQTLCMRPQRRHPPSPPVTPSP